MKLELSRFLCWVGVALASAACVGNEDGDGSGGPDGGATWGRERLNALGGTRECALDTGTSARNYDNCVSKCWELAVTAPGYDCEGVCRDLWCAGCSRDSTACDRYRYSFDTSSVAPIQELEEACNAAVERDEECGSSSVGDNCELVARVESKDTLEAYNCVAETACEGDAGPCYPSAPEPKLRQTVCETIDDACWAHRCTREGEELLDIAESWFTVEALEAAQGCLSETSCIDIQNCLVAWQRAVFAGSPNADIDIVEAD